ncbi:hypothetical protein G6F22_014030 [Rhizopus arrhizus]|nr:hypothetical protein G6F22_014030 [Rhizopus arrhizus]
MRLPAPMRTVPRTVARGDTWALESMWDANAGSASARVARSFHHMRVPRRLVAHRLAAGEQPGKAVHHPDRIGQQYIQHREGGGRHQPGAAMMDGADQRQQHDHAYPEQRHHRQCQAGGPMQHRRAEPDLQGQHDAGQRQQHHRQDAEQAEAAQQQAAMQAHADRIADDPAPPSSPFLHQRVALLRVDHAAHALAHTVTLRDQRPGHVQVFHAGAVGEADLAQHRGAEQAARAGADERRAAQPLLVAALDHDHRQFQAGTHMRQEAGALQAGRGHAADRIGARLEFVQQVSQAMPARIDMGVGVGQEHLFGRGVLQAVHQCPAFAGVGLITRAR